MPEKNFILKRIWQSRHGLKEYLYLGYNEFNHIDCIADRNKAKIMTYDECKDWKLILTNSDEWTIERFEEITEEPYEELVTEEIIKENTTQ